MTPGLEASAAAEAATQAALQALAEGRLQEALAHAREASAAAPHHAMMHNNEGVVLHALGQHEQALASYERALQLNPTLLHALVNRAAPWRDMGHPQQAQACLQQAVQAHPNSVPARWNLALLLLAQGHYEQAWPLFESRWEPTGHCAGLLRPYEPPPWRGEAAQLRGQRLLIKPEQGLGDALQFVRFVPHLLQHGAQVVLEVQPPLLRLFQHVLGAATTVLPMSPLAPMADFSVGVMGLAAVCGLQAPHQLVQPGAPGAEVPYLSVPTQVLQAWAERLGPKRRPRLGLMWGGNPQHAQNRRRSVPLQALLPTLMAHGGQHFELVSLQKELPPEDLALLQHYPTVRHFGPEQADLLDAAALCQLCDAVLTVDTSMAHLAGGLGCPTWVMLHASADWRWGLKGNRSPWYPSARLVRQTTWGDWQAVVQQATATIAAHGGVSI